VWRSLSLSCALAVATCLVGLTEASTQDRCRVMDPTGTPLNFRTAPNGHVVGTLSNGTLVKILDRPSNVGGRTWVYVGRYEDRVPIGWVYRNYLDCTRNATMEQFRRLPGQAFKWGRINKALSISGRWPAMLQNLSKDIRECYLQAEQCRRWAEVAPTQSERWIFSTWSLAISGAKL